ncbi:DUF3899 domain-containing protein [Planococcus sp. S3-L1]|uniref:DUF3899 domain-containing protein n=1 Tax=Planococcus sp. S3-L1 TaxID=3046200 RepID=UPI0024B9FA47|nr:DUF3899 domain-containing protein [Planococcus sp. S3-L1]MDJ0331362.1 DUF3899 domain-containing protein [Planococcus sp. S3-L1]
MNFKAILLLTSLSISMLLSFFLYKSWSLINWANALFLVGLLLIMIYSMMILIEGQFFTAFLTSTRNFFAKINKKDQVIQESEKRSLIPVTYRREFPNRKSFLQIGLFFCIGSLLVSFF